MILYKNDMRVYKGGDLDEVYASNPTRFTHATQKNYLRKLVQEDLLAPNASQKITCLDIGCGQGALLNILYKILKEHNTQGVSPLNFYGLDVSEVAIDQANQAYHEHHWIVDSFQEFNAKSAEKFSLKNNFSIILNRGGLTSLESMDEYEKMLSYVNELLCENGIYFFSQNNNYYRIWLNNMLRSSSTPENPVPSIFKIADSIFECIQFYNLPGDYLGIYRKRSSKNYSYTSSHKSEPFAVKLNLNDGKEPTLFVSGDQFSCRFLTKYTMSQEEREEFIFDVPLIYQEARIEAERELCMLASTINAGNTSKPRFFISNFQVRNPVTETTVGIKNFLEEKNHTARFLYFPRRFLTIRDICRFYAEIRQSFPEGAILGIGLQDHRIDDADCLQPLVDLDEYTNRLDWLFDTLLRDSISPLWCLTRFEQDLEIANSKSFYRASDAKIFTEVELQMCQKYGVKFVDLRGLFEVKDKNIFRKESLTRLKIGIESQSNTSKNLAFSSSHLSNQEIKSFPHYLPTGGSLILDDGTSIPMSSIDAEHIYFSAPLDIYANQLHNDGFDLRIINVNGIDFFSHSLQRKVCIELQRSYDESLPNVLIMGDSTKMRSRDYTGYGQKAYNSLKRIANVMHLTENWGGTTIQKRIVQNMIKSNMRPNIVHINAGLHDVMVNRWSKQYKGYNDIQTYCENVRDIIRSLWKINDLKTIIWATMTPIHPEWHDIKPDGTLREYVRTVDDILEYNARATETAIQEGAQINDLYTAIQQAGIEQCILRDGVHLSSYGSTIAGGLVANKLKEALKKLI